MSEVLSNAPWPHELPQQLHWRYVRNPIEFLPTAGMPGHALHFRVAPPKVM